MNISTFIRKVKKLGLRLGFMKFIGYKAIFTCAFRPLGSDEAYKILPHSDDYWYADPLVFTRDGRDILFMERVDRHTGLGAIVYSDITDGDWSDPVPIITEPFHMSFPMCFEWNGELYMLPETSMDHAINLYRCVSFPDKWEHAARIMDGMKLVDTVVESQAADGIIFWTSEHQEGEGFYTRFRKFRICHDATGDIVGEDLGAVGDEYTLKSRMAGYPLEREGHIVYPIQRSTSGVYGYSVEFHRDEPLTGDLVREITPSSVRCDAGRRLIGVHTYSVSDRYEVIDVQYLAK